MYNIPTFHSLDRAYQHALESVLYSPEYICQPRGMLIKEVIGYSFMVVGPTDSVPIITANKERNAVIATYTKAEFGLYASMSQNADDYAAAANFWKKIENPDGTINSAYGHLIFGRKVCGSPKYEASSRGIDFMLDCQEDFCALVNAENAFMRTPWEWAMLALKTDKDSRQAILHFNTPDMEWVGNKDVTCTLTAQFLIRENLLHMIVNMRSNDVVLGLVYDCVWFSSLMHRAVNQLKSDYPLLHVGNYIHQAGSMHVYDKHFKLAESMVI